MKVLSLTEPCATLIKEKKKLIETRSWKTSYRGELYIHASSTAIPKDWKNDREFMALVNNIPLNFGNIICKCNLVDCVYMTKEYVENIQVLENPIKTKGHLSIWNYEDKCKICDSENVNNGGIK